MNNIINEIIARDRVLGDLSYEAELCSSEDKNMASIACLFILAEQALKMGLCQNEGNFCNLIKTAEKNQIISDDDSIILNKLRLIRNKMFHENHYMNFIEIDGIAYPFSENETKKIIYEKLSIKIFDIIMKL